MFIKNTATRRQNQKHVLVSVNGTHLFLQMISSNASLKFAVLIAAQEKKQCSTKADKQYLWKIKLITASVTIAVDSSLD